MEDEEIINAFVKTCEAEQKYFEAGARKRDAEAKDISQPSWMKLANWIGVFVGLATLTTGVVQMFDVAVARKEAEHKARVAELDTKKLEIGQATLKAEKEKSDRAKADIAEQYLEIASQKSDIERRNRALDARVQALSADKQEADKIIKQLTAERDTSAEKANQLVIKNKELMSEVETLKDVKGRLFQETVVLKYKLNEKKDGRKASEVSNDSSADFIPNPVLFPPPRAIEFE